MKLFIAITSGAPHTTQRIIEELESLSIPYTLFNPYQDCESLKIGENCIIINRVSGISYDDSDLNLYMDNQNYIVYNDPKYSRIFRDKFKQYSYFIKSKISTIPSCSLEGIYKDKIDVFINQNSNDRFLIKPLRSNQAQGIITPLNLKDEIVRIKNSNDQRYILQPFLQKRREWRVLVINKVVVAIMEKTSRHGVFSILNCANSDIRLVAKEDIKPELTKLINQCIVEIPLFIFAIDILEDLKEEYKVIEVNNIPGLKFVEEVSGINIAKLFIEQLLMDQQQKTSVN